MCWWVGCTCTRDSFLSKDQIWFKADDVFTDLLDVVFLHLQDFCEIFLASDFYISLNEIRLWLYIFATTMCCWCLFKLEIHQVRFSFHGSGFLFLDSPHLCGAPVMGATWPASVCYSVSSSTSLINMNVFVGQSYLALTLLVLQGAVKKYNSRVFDEAAHAWVCYILIQHHSLQHTWIFNNPTRHLNTKSFDHCNNFS